MRNGYNKSNTGGISQKNRDLLDEINRKLRTPFNITDVSSILNIPLNKAKRLVAYFTSRGWLSRIKKGLYITIPLGSIDPSNRKEDPWIVAAVVFKPCYIGGWSACEHWGLTDQIFKDIVLFTSRKVRHRRNEIQDTVYIIRNINTEKIFGTKPVWRGQNKILVSDPSRTIVDILNEPYLGGGIRNVATILEEYFIGDTKDESKLINYIIRLKNGAIFKRLGYLIETLGIHAPKTIEICKKNITTGYSVLDPSLPSKGKLLRRWNIRINALVEKE